MLLTYAAPDGSLTRVQLVTGLRRDFAKADVDRNGCLNENEVRKINQQRWKDDASSASPLIDFKNNGCLDFDEYAAEPLSLFDQLDAKGTGKLTAAQLKPGSKPSTQQGQSTNGDQGRHHGGGDAGPSATTGQSG